MKAPQGVLLLTMRAELSQFVRDFRVRMLAMLTPRRKVTLAMMRRQAGLKRFRRLLKGGKR